MIATLLTSVAASALVGSPHCAGMCGGFVCFYSGDARSAWRAHAAYNAGRLASYVTLGVLAAFLGARLDSLGALAGFRHAAAILAGALMIVWGASTFAAAGGLRLRGAAHGASRTGALVARALRGVSARPPVVRALAMGLLSTLLPCGFLYAFVAVAAGTAHPASGALVMAVFWLGTAPIMFGLGAIAHRVIAPFRRRVPLATAGVLVVLGLLTITGKFRPATADGCATCATAGTEHSAR